MKSNALAPRQCYWEHDGTSAMFHAWNGIPLMVGGLVRMTHRRTSFQACVVIKVALRNSTKLVQFGLGVTDQLVDVLALAYRTLSRGTSGSGQERLVEQVVARSRHFGWVAVGKSRLLGELGVIERHGVA